MSHISTVQINDGSYHKIEPILYGSCSTAANTEIKDVVLVDNNGYELTPGIQIAVSFSVTNTAATDNLKLRVESNSINDAKSIKYMNAALTSADILASGKIYNFVYDGTSWNIVGDLSGSNVLTKSDTITVSQGGTNITSYNIGDILYASATTTLSKLSGNTTTTRKFLSSVAAIEGTAMAPTWASLTANDIPVITKSKISDFSHTHGNIANDGTITSGNGNRLLYTNNDGLVAETGHYATLTKIAINNTSEPTENLYVNGNIQFNIGTSDSVSNKQFIIYGDTQFVSIGGEGIQAYSGTTSDSTAKTLFIQSRGGNLTVGSSSYESASHTMYGKFDFTSSNGFTYSAMGATNSLNIDRPIWIMGASNASSLIQGRPVYSTNLAFNTSTETLKIGSGSISATNYSGTAAKATADASGNTITTTYAPIDSPTFTGTPLITTTPDNGDNSHKIADTAYVMNTLRYADAMIFKGTIGENGTINTAADPVETLPAIHDAGWTYKVITAGTYAGMVCEIGDLIICVADGTSASNSDWTSVQVNEDGVVIGPASATDNAIARFDQTSGKLIQNSKITINDDGQMLIQHTQDTSDAIKFTYGSNIDFQIGISHDNTNHGIYDNNDSKWVLSATATNHNWQLNGNAATATALATARELYVDLETVRNANSPVTFDGSADKVLHIGGVLDTGNGGTGTSIAPTVGGIIYGAIDNNNKIIYRSTSAGTQGQVLISNGSNAPSWYSGLTLLSDTTNSPATYSASFNGTVSIVGNTSVGGTLSVTSTTTLGGDLTITGNIIPSSNTYTLGTGSTNAKRWGALYIGSTDDYGDTYQSIYWNDGVPTVSYPVQYFTWTISAGKMGVVLTHSALTEDTFPLAIVVTSGEEYLTGPITWNNAKDNSNNQFKLTIPTELPTGQSVSGYCIVARGTAISPTSTAVDPPTEDDTQSNT